MPVDSIYDSPPNAAVLELIESTDATVLDVGCGTGANARVLHGRGLEVDGVTFSAREAEAARPWCRRVCVHDLERGLPEELRGPYDVILVSHLLEHICQPAALLRDLDRLMKPSGGRVIVAIPNLLYYKNRLKLLVGRIEYEEAGLMDSTHYKWYSYGSARALLEDHGLAVERQFADGSAPLWRLRSVLPGLCAKIDRLASRLLPGLFGYQLIYVARRRMECR